MFRIKTDVRQYKCESHDKVVRLIRNWVIRPSDEIYNEEADAWEPIGEHEAFESTFREMEKAEEGVAETVVSPEPADEKEAQGDAEQSLDEDDAGPDGAESGESVEPPATPPDREVGPESDPGGQGPEDVGEEPDEVVVGSQSQPDEVTAVTSGEESSQDETPEPPSAPEGVTTGREYADSDEITVMTEETLDAVLEDGEEGDGDIEAANAREPAPRDDLSEDLDHKDEKAPDEPPTIPPDEPTQPGDDADEETDESSAPDMPDETAESPEDSDEDEGDSDSVTTRDDLPEEVFATNRIEKDDVDTESRDSASESKQDESDAVSAREDEKEADDTGGQSDADEWDEILQRLRDTDELDGEEIDRIQETRDELAIGRDEPVDDEPTDQTAEYYGASGGYEWNLPDYVAPTPADRSHGLTAESVTEAQKDAVFPYPGPKQQDNVYTREFDLGAESSQGLTRPMLVRVVVAAAVVLAVVALLFAV